MSVSVAKQRRLSRGKDSAGDGTVKVMVVLGTRPEVIKLSPVVAALRPLAETIVCASGQHRELLSQALASFGIVPDVAFDTMQKDHSLNGLAAHLIADLDIAIERTAPDWVLVQGDTTTAFCAGFAAFNRGVKVGHVEAGLRTGDLASPFPEEANRQLLSRIASHHFPPTDAARAALLAEGIPPAQITVTGNTVVDAIEQRRRSWTVEESATDTTPIVLVTCHRRENMGERLTGICTAIARLCARYPDHRFVFPLHYNPAVRGPVRRQLGGIANLKLIEPIDYDDNLRLIGRSTLIITDSGGIQEEAPSFGVPVVVMRDHTERLEGVTAGFATLAGCEPEAIESAAAGWLDDPARRRTLVDRPNPYGDGLAADRIAATLLGGVATPFSPA